MRSKRPDRERLKNLIPSFTKAKTPGYGISRDYYLSVLSGTASLPAITSVLNPKGDGGALVGFGAPLKTGSTKSDLDRSMQRGAYAVASTDRKTVIQLLVVSKEEVGFDPSPIISSAIAKDLSRETLNRISATWSLLQLRFEAHDPMVAPSAFFLLQVANRLAQLTDGVVADPISQRYMLPDEVIHPGTTTTTLDVRDFVSVRSRGQNLQNVYTLGLLKFGLPEFELLDVSPSVVSAAQEFLIGLAQLVLNRGPVEAGALVGDERAPLEVRTGGLERGYWEGIPVYELFPIKSRSVDEAIDAWLTRKR